MREKFGQKMQGALGWGAENSGHPLVNPTGLFGGGMDTVYTYMICRIFRSGYISLATYLAHCDHPPKGILNVLSCNSIMNSQVDFGCEKI